MKESKILHIVNSLNLGGAERLVADIAISDPQKFEVLSLKHSNTYYVSLLQDKDVKVSFLTKRSLYNPLLIFKIIPFLHKFNVIHVHLFPALYWVVMAKMISFSNVMLVYTEHNTNNRRRNSGLFKFLDKLVYSQLDFIGCISNSTEHNLRKHLNKLKTNSKIKTIVNGIDLNRFDTAKVTKVDYDFWKPSDFILMQISSFRKQKDQKTLIKSLIGLPENIKLLLIGEGLLLEEHKVLVQELGLQKRVRFLGIRSDIPELLKYCDVSVLSSHYEGFGLVALEGMAMKKPVIAAHVEGLSDVVGEAGLLFEKGNIPDLQKQIMYLYNDLFLYDEVSKKCYLRALEYDINKMINTYNGIYKKVMEKV